MIRLKEAFLHPYRCMEETQNITFDKNLTALIGRNEAGKTSVLEALAKANYFAKEDEHFQFNLMEDYPRKYLKGMGEEQASAPAVTITYEVSEKLAEEIGKEMLLPEKNLEFTRITNYAGVGRITENGLSYDPYQFWEAYAKKKAPELEDVWKKLAGLRTREEYHRCCTRILDSTGSQGRENLRKALQEAGKYFDNFHNWENPLNEYVYRVYLLPHIPKFLYYDECYLLPSRISIDRLVAGENLTPSERTAQAFLSLSGMDAKKLKDEGHAVTNKLELEIAQAKLTRELLHYWTGNPDLELTFEISKEQEVSDEKGGFFSSRKKKKAEEKTYLDIRVRDKRSMVALPLGNRSKGFNWFFSFWVWFAAIRNMEDMPFVLLLDEPGLHLYEDAQKDLLRFLTDLSKNYQILYTTHSPYLLEKMEGSIYRIDRGERGSVIRKV